MQKNTIILRQKKMLTADVYELIYESEEKIDIQPGQFLLCDCDMHDPTKKRSYSLSYSDGFRHEFIIKQLENGTGGSKAICDQDIGHGMDVWGPLGGFVLKQSTADMLFIGTGTGFAPLYFMIGSLLDAGCTSRVHFEFGVRYDEDVFFVPILESWSEKYPFFSYSICLSRPNNRSRYKEGYVTDILEADVLADMDFDLAAMQSYICGSPAMVQDAKKKLLDLGMDSKHIAYEQY